MCNKHSMCSTFLIEPRDI